MKESGIMHITSLDDAFDSSIELGISKNGSWQFFDDNKTAIMETKEGHTYIQTDGGKLYVPNDMVLDIDVTCPIKGVTACSGAILSERSIDLVILRKKNLKVALESYDSIAINNYPMTDPDDYFGLSSYILATQDFNDEYLSMLPNPEIISENNLIKAKFLNNRAEKIFPYEVAMYSKMLYVFSEESLNIYDRGIQKKFLNIRTPREKAALVDHLVTAINRNDFKNSKRLSYTIKRLGNPVNSTRTSEEIKISKGLEGYFIKASFNK